MISVTHAQQLSARTPAALAQLRFLLMRDLSWADWDHPEEWWFWEKTHVDILEAKLATLLAQNAEEDTP
jgi:hypothetical protein